MPMSKIFTLLYSVDDFDESEEQFLDINQLLDEESNEFEEVFKMLDMIEFTPKDETIQKILNISKNLDSTEL
jgi:hypothetical protein